MMKYAEQIAYSSKETLHFTYDMARIYAGADGCFVECGVAAGAQIIAMRYGAPDKLIHAFDSFKGIPLPSNRDYVMPGIKNLNPLERRALPNPGEQKLESTGVTAIDIESFKTHLIDSGCGLDNIVIHEGWFEETLPDNDVGEISILRLDGDLYNSTYTCLKYLFPKLMKGGILILDDYELQGCFEACEEYFKEINYTPNWRRVSNIGFFEK